MNYVDPERMTFHQLERPTSGGALTLLNVTVEGPADEVRAQAYSWARETWRA